MRALTDGPAVCRMRASDWQRTSRKLHQALLPPHPKEDEGRDILCSDLKRKSPEETLGESIAYSVAKLEGPLSLRELLPRSVPIQDWKAFTRPEDARKLLDEIDDDVERERVASLLKVTLEVPLKSQIESDAALQKKSLLSFSNQNSTLMKDESTSTTFRYLPLELPEVRWVFVVM